MGWVVGGPCGAAGGAIYADFYYQTGDGGVTYDATDSIDTHNSSAGFHFTLLDVNLLANETGLMVESEVIEHKEMRRFVTFRA